MSVVFEKTSLLTDKPFHYCPGCNHGIIHRLVAEAIDELKLDGNVIGVAPVGCSVSRISISTATCTRQRMAAPPQSQPASSA